MALLDWSQCPAVESIPGKVSGSWVLRNTRMPVATIFENLEAGANIDDILAWYDGLDRDQVKAVIEFAARSLDTPVASRGMRVLEVLLTTDKNMRYQQNMAGRTIAVVVIGLQQWPALQPHVALVVAAVNAATPGSLTEVDIPIDGPPARQPEARLTAARGLFLPGRERTS